MSEGTITGIGMPVTLDGHRLTGLLEVNSLDSALQLARQAPANSQPGPGWAMWLSAPGGRAGALNVVSKIVDQKARQDVHADPLS